VADLRSATAVAAVADQRGHAWDFTQRTLPATQRTPLRETEPAIGERNAQRPNADQP
jgi:hypothetical protein